MSDQVLIVESIDLDKNLVTTLVKENPGNFARMC